MLCPSDSLRPRVRFGVLVSRSLLNPRHQGCFPLVFHFSYSPVAPRFLRLVRGELMVLVEASVDEVCLLVPLECVLTLASSASPSICIHVTVSVPPPLLVPLLGCRWLRAHRLDITRQISC
jgi:hypothetical protein